MHIQTHIMSGWIVANFFTLTPRERLFCMVAAATADLDGLGILVSEDLYQDFHHVAGHNLTMGILLASILTYFSINRVKAWLLYLGIFNLHILMDLLGSGELWTIHYLWPFTSHELYLEHCWPLYSWQNITIGFVSIIATVIIAVWRQRTPLEVPMPRLDRKLVRFFSAIVSGTRLALWGPGANVQNR